MSPLRAGSITLSYEPLCVNVNPNTWESLHTHSRREGCRRQKKDGQRNRWKEEGRSQAESLSKDTTCSCSLTSIHISQQHLLWPTHHSITHHSLTRHHAQSQSWFLFIFLFFPSQRVEIPAMPHTELYGLTHILNLFESSEGKSS